MPEEIVSEHYGTPAPPPVSIYGLLDHELGGLGLLSSKSRIFYRDDILPAYYTHYLADGTHRLSQQWTGALFDSYAEVIEVDVPVAVALHPNLVYGHFLIEMLPRLHLLSRLRRSGLPFVIAIPDKIADWAKQIIGLYFDQDEIISYDADRQRVRSPCFILPSMMHTTYRLHPDFNLAIDEVVDFVLPKVKASIEPRIWLSRTKNPGWRRIANEAQAEKVASSLGFAIVHPQDFSFPEQIALFQAAECVAGEFTSATHNTIFSPLGTRVFCINRVNWYQSCIGELRSQPIAYMAPRDGRFRDWRCQGSDDNAFEIDVADLRNQLAEFVG